MRAFESLGWEVHPYIVGDRLPPRISSDSERMIMANRARAAVADVTRLGLGIVSGRRAVRELSGQVDWVYERFAVLQALGRAFQRRGIPWILEANGPFFHEARVDRSSLALVRLAKRLELRAYRQCDVLVCVSTALRDLIVDQAKINPAKVVVVPNGVDVDRFDPDSCTPRRFSNDFTIGFVGAILGWQGLDVLLQAVANVNESGKPIHVVIVGDGPARSELESLVNSLGIETRVTFVGRVDWNAVPSYITGFDIAYSGQVRSRLGVMYHSPLKLYEYMAMGKPVIASAFDDARNLVEGKHTGFLFQPGNQPELVEVLHRAFERRSDLDRMGDLARQLIIRHHSWEARVGEMIPQVESVLRNKTTSSG